ncbi:MAG: biotin--[Bacteroidaceae bacterium]|nr:biotin--[acetyl-CoA-carboxylase] ligase [Bacteroidaceae bacterium]
MNLRRVELAETVSTNTFAKGLDDAADGVWTLVTAEFQTAGRGAGENRWESERSKNLLFSLRMKPKGVAAARMFALSEALALAVCGALDEYGSGFCIKWPNDIYHADRKMVGMLIENTLRGDLVDTSVMGVGINVNQRLFRSDAPNPVSLFQVLGHEVERETLLTSVVSHLAEECARVTDGQYDALHQRYVARLYRRGEEHAYRDAAGTFRATLTDVEPTGHLLLRDTQGLERRYAFKEITYII